MSQGILVIVYQTLVLSVVEYGFRILTLSMVQINRLEGSRVVGNGGSDELRLLCSYGTFHLFF